MRAASTAVVLSSLLIGSAAIAQPTTGTPAPTKTGGPTTTTTGAPSKTGSGAPTTPGTTATPGTTGAADTTGTPAPAPQPDPSTVKPEDMPTAVRTRRLEQQTQALKERAWQLKARVQMLKEQMLGGGVGSQAVIAHSNEMGSSFRLTRLIYTLDGTQVFVRSDEAGEGLYKTKSFDIFAGPIAPGTHTLAAVATYRGHGYGVFEYLSKYTFTAKGNQSFTAGDGKIARVDCKGHEKGGPTTPLEKRPAVTCKVTQVQPEKAPSAPSPTPGSPSSPTPTPAAPATEPGK